MHLKGSIRTVGLLTLSSCLTLGFLGCDLLNQAQTPPAKKTESQASSRDRRMPVHRFVLTRLNPDVAFDTQTGQICRTWDWQPLGKAATPDATTGMTPQRQFGEFTPTCLSLYQTYPSATTPESETIPDDQQ